MAIADTILSMATNIENAYDKIEDKGGTIPQNKNLENLADAIDTITGGTPTPPEPTPTSMSYFEANGTELTKYTGSLSEVVIPKSYSKTETIIGTVTGAELNSSRATTGSLYAPSGYITLTFTDGTNTSSINIGYGYTDTLENLEAFLSQNFTTTPVLQSMTQSGGGWLGAPIEIFEQMCDSQVNFLKFPFSAFDTYNYQNLTFYSYSDLYSYISSYSSSQQSNITFSFTDTITLKTVTFYDGNDYQITSIGNGLFAENTSVVKITILDNITTVGKRAFYKCSNLTTLIMADSVTTLTNDTSDYEGMFYQDKKLKNVILSNNITMIPQCCFSQCSELEELNLPSALTNIQYAAFSGCVKLLRLDIPKNVSFINAQAFTSCQSLVEFTVDSENTTYDSRDNCNCIITTATNTLLAGGGWGTIPASVTSIGNYAFQNRRNLSGTVTIPASVTSIGSYAFNASGIGTVTIPASVTSIADWAFQNCRYLGTVTFSTRSDNLTIGSSVFSGCTNLSTISIPSTVTSMGTSIFNGCTKLATIIISANISTAIGNSMFYGCSSLKAITIPSNVTTIGNSAFNGCTSLSEITIPNTITSIGTSAFNGCTNLVTVDIPASVTSIGNTAFKGCTKLQTANIYATSSTTKISSYSNAWFNSCSSSLVLHIPSSVTAPTTAYGTYWNYYGSGSTLTYYADL